MSFIDYFGEITDPRKDINVKHNLLDVIFLTITAVISGCEGWKDIYDFGRVKLSWLRQYLEHLRPDDIVVVCKLDRLARSTHHLLELVECIRGAEASFCSL